MVLSKPVIARKSREKIIIPPYEERLPQFDGPLHRFEMIIEWHRSLDKTPRIQRLGFKASGDLLNAVLQAQRLTEMLRKSYGKTQTEIKESQFCRLVAVYEERAFIDYSAEPIYNKEVQRTQLKKHVENVRAYDETVSTKIPRNSVRTVRVQ